MLAFYINKGNAVEIVTIDSVPYDKFIDLGIVDGEQLTRPMTLDEYAESYVNEDDWAKENGWVYIGSDLEIPLLSAGEIYSWDPDQKKVIAKVKPLKRSEYVSQEESKGFEITVPISEKEAKTFKLKAFQEDQQQFSNHNSVITGLRVNGIPVPETQTFLDFYGVPQTVPTELYVQILAAYAGHCMTITQNKWQYDE